MVEAPPNSKCRIKAVRDRHDALRPQKGARTYGRSVSGILCFVLSPHLFRKIRAIWICFPLLLQIHAHAAPSISGVANASSFIGAGLPNSGITPSTLFAITGSLLADLSATAI